MTLYNSLISTQPKLIWGFFLFFFFFFFNWLLWVFVAVHRLSLVTVSGATL